MLDWRNGYEQRIMDFDDEQAEPQDLTDEGRNIAKAFRVAVTLAGVLIGLASVIAMLWGG